MIGDPIADPRAKVTADLNDQITVFFATGHSVQQIPRGVTGDKRITGAVSPPPALKDPRLKTKS